MSRSWRDIARADEYGIAGGRLDVCRVRDSRGFLQFQISQSRSADECYEHASYQMLFHNPIYVLGRTVPHSNPRFPLPQRVLGRSGSCSEENLQHSSCTNYPRLSTHCSRTATVVFPMLADTFSPGP